MLKIEIENWGPIERFEYDFYKIHDSCLWENNIGKSYAMQVVYLFLNT